MLIPDFEQAKRHVIDLLSRDLSPHLTYHSLQHTRDDVLPAAARLGRAVGLGNEEFLILTTAALFHDTGFLLAYKDHERESIAITRDTLPGFGYSRAQVERVVELIAATRVPQRPRGPLQELICDADLDLLGRDDFPRLNRVLMQEVRHFTSPNLTEQAWLINQMRFLEEHKFFTAAARAFRAVGKANNLAYVRAAVAALNGHSPAVAD